VPINPAEVFYCWWCLTEPKVLLEVNVGVDLSEVLNVVRRHSDVEGVYIVNSLSDLSEVGLKALKDFLNGLKEGSIALIPLSRDSLKLFKDFTLDLINKVKVVPVVKDLSVVEELKGVYSDVCFNTVNPYLNVSELIKSGVTCLIQPHAVLRSRTVKEAVAKGVKVVAVGVNSPEVYLKVESMNVYAVTTEKPNIKREAKLG